MSDPILKKQLSLKMKPNKVKLPAYFKTQFKVVSVHFTTECNLHCPFCYRPRDTMGEIRPREFFLDLVPYVKKIAPQIALGGGEPLTDPPFLRKMGERCKKEGVILNFTTNGTLFSKMSDHEIQEILKDITMISISFDYFKWGKNTDMFARTVQRIKQIMGRKEQFTEGPTTVHTPIIGANLLLDKGMFKDKGVPFINIVRWLFLTAPVDQVYALYPKFHEFIDILPAKPIFSYLTHKYPFFFVDEFIRKVFEEGYTNWVHPCHYGKDMININEIGEVTGCSFESKSVLILEKPRDLLKILDVEFENRMICPFITPS